MVTRALVLKAAGTNCEQETVEACRMVGFTVDLKVIKEVKRGILASYGLVVIAGGFSYGDYFGSGVIFADEVNNKIGEELISIIGNGGLLLGICNGFQVLTRSGLLPDPKSSSRVSLKPNSSGKFECRWIHMKIQSNKCVFLKGLDLIELPVNHGEGKFVAENNGELRKLYLNEQIALKYVRSTGEPAVGYPENPNGSVDDIAGITDVTGRVLGLMPHPERFIIPQHHPNWTRRSISKCYGLEMFKNAFDYLENNV